MLLFVRKQLEMVEFMGNGSGRATVPGIAEAFVSGFRIALRLACAALADKKIMPHSPLILFESRGCCCLATRPKFGRVTAFCLHAGKPSSEPFKADTGDSGGRARGGSGTKYDFRALHLRIEAIIGSYTMDFTSIFEGRFSSGRKAVRQTPCRIHSGRQSRPLFIAF